jgi:hypothetical protein
MLCLEPIDQLVHERLDGRATSVEVQMRLFVRRASCVKQALEVGAIGRERAAAVLGYTRNNQLERHIEPHRSAVGLDDGAILRIHERPAAGRDDGMAQRHLVREYGPFYTAEVRLAVPLKNLSDGEMLALLDLFVDIDEAPVEPLRESPPNARFAGSHEADEVHLVRPHATSRPSVSKNPG